jgi:RimJ/RimL family protein N-acetyltransferase
VHGEPPPISIEFPLRDGTLVAIRPILPSDADRLRDGFERLSPESRYRRFMSAVDELSDEQVYFLTHVDYEDHMAWVALDPLDPGRRGLGVARYVRVADEPSVAEAAVTVVDSHQGRGLGTVLLGVLALSALRNGIGTFRALVLEANAQMLAILRDLGAKAEHDGSSFRVDVPLPADPEDLPDTPAGRVFRSVAKRLLDPFVTRPQRGGRGVGRMA